MEMELERSGTIITGRVNLGNRMVWNSVPV